MAITLKQAKKFESYEDIRRQLMTAKEIASQNAEVEREIDALRSMQDSVTKAVAGFMTANDIGFNELTRRLKTSTRQSSKILKGEANITLATLAELASVMGKKARIIFE